MMFVNQLSTLALRVVWGVEGADTLVRFVGSRFSAHTDRLAGALATANDRAWKALEVALAGQSWWDRCKGLLSSGDEKKFRNDIEAFLQSAGAGTAGLTTDLRRRALEDLQRARQARLIPGDRPAPDELALQAQTLAGCRTQQHLLVAEDQALGGLIGGLRQTGYLALAHVAALRPTGGHPLLVVGVRYFFSREVLGNEELREAMTLQQLEGLTAAQEAGFRGLGEALERHGEILARVEAATLQTQRGVMEVKEAVERQGEHAQETQELIVLMRQEMRALSARLSEERAEHRQKLEEMQGALQEVMGLCERRPPAPSAPSVQPAPPPAAEETQRIKTVLRRATRLVASQREEMPTFYQALSEWERAENTSATAAPTPAAPTPAAPGTAGTRINPLFAAGLGATADDPPVFRPRANPKPVFPTEAPATVEQPESPPAEPAAAEKSRQGPIAGFKLVRRDGKGPLFRPPGQ